MAPSPPSGPARNVLGPLRTTAWLTEAQRKALHIAFIVLPLELEGTEAGYGAAVVLHGVSLSVMAGERLAIVGRNGAGKTTTLATAMGLTRLFAGSVRLEGLDIGRAVIGGLSIVLMAIVLDRITQSMAQKK